MQITLSVPGKCPWAIISDFQDFSNHQSSTHTMQKNSDLVEFDVSLHPTGPDGIEQSESTNSINIGCVLTEVKGQLCGVDKILRY
jgi:hypothetical protein